MCRCVFSWSRPVPESKVAMNRRSPKWTRTPSSRRVACLPGFGKHGVCLARLGDGERVQGHSLPVRPIVVNLISCKPARRSRASMPLAWRMPWSLGGSPVAPTGSKIARAALVVHSSLIDQTAGLRGLTRHHRDANGLGRPELSEKLTARCSGNVRSQAMFVLRVFLPASITQG